MIFYEYLENSRQPTASRITHSGALLYDIGGAGVPFYRSHALGISPQESSTAQELKRRKDHQSPYHSLREGEPPLEGRADKR